MEQNNHKKSLIEEEMEHMYDHSPFIQQTQKALKRVIEDASKKEIKTVEEKQFLAALQFVETIIAEGMTTILYNELVMAFPSYFHFPQTEFFLRYWGDAIENKRADIESGFIENKIFKREM